MYVDIGKAVIQFKVTETMENWRLFRKNFT